MNELPQRIILPDYGEFARMLYGTCILSDPWLNGKERFRLQGLVLESRQADALNLAAERIGRVYHELVDIICRHPHFADDYFHLTPFQKAMWLSSEGRWHGIARIDLFLCSDGEIRTCEMNSDTPSGEAEAVLLNELLHPYYPGTINPNAEFEEQFWQMLRAFHQSRLASLTNAADKKNDALDDASLKTIAIIYPTDLPEDLSMIAIYRQWLERRGCRVLIGSPYNLGLTSDKQVTVFNQPVELILRHYKTDWWGERETIWHNQQPYADPDPLDRELLILLNAEMEARVSVVNPFGSVLTQNKLAMAFMWEHQEMFSAASRQWIRQYFPEARRLTAIDVNSLDRGQWVLKSSYGCEGDSVVVGRFVKPQDWRVALSAIIPQHWIAQRYFEVATTEDNYLPNIGAYLIGGRASGFYVRLSAKATDYTSVSAPVFVKRRTA
jgi:glutathionylspermidine synthase